MEPLVATVAQALPGVERILCAFSGGMDSTVLLRLLVQLRTHTQIKEVRCCHIHHGLSPHADHWAQWCIEQCQALQVACQIVPVQVIDRKALGIEGAARKVRYAALAQQLQKGEVLATAHHLEDQCETVLLALKRGSGPAGLSAMARQKAFTFSHLYRPLLHVPHAALHAYAQQQQLKWIEDKSNQALCFDRNFLRQVIIPQLVARWPAFIKSSARSAQLCAEQEQLLDASLQAPLQALLTPQGALSIHGLAHYSALQRQALLRRWCRFKGAPLPTYQLLIQLWNEVALCRRDANPCLPLGTWQLRRFLDHLYLLPPAPPLPPHLAWDLTTDLPLPGDLGTLCLQTTGATPIRRATPQQKVTVRFGLHGQLRIAQRGLRRVKKVYQEKKIPPWMRRRLPVLYYDEEAIAIPEVLITEAGAPSPGEAALYITWKRRQ